MSSVPKVAILGGGISGITSGIVLQMHGFRTKVFTHLRLDEIHPVDAKRRPPEIASIHAAASVLPHSASSPRIEEWTRVSQLAFHRLAFCGHFGVRVQRHYELFEKPRAFPNYAREVKDFTPLKDNGTSWVDDRSIPRRSKAPGVWGWYFNAFFAEVPTYISCLYDLYDAIGGEVEIVPSTVDLPAFTKLASDWGADAQIVCAGYGSLRVLGEPGLKEIPVTRGHMVKVHVYDVPHDRADRYFSYNYTPVPLHEFTDVDDKEADVYCYPRSDGWLLGGSRQEGFFNPETNVWRPAGEEATREQFEAKRDYFKRTDDWLERIPRRIWNLNQELLFDITRKDINRYPSSSYIGYRFPTSPIQTGFDEQATSAAKIPTYKNFGHGGSGYTLSWGCAWDLLAEMESRNFPTTISEYRHVTQSDRRRRSALAILTSLEDMARSEKAMRNMPKFV